MSRYLLDDLNSNEFYFDKNIKIESQIIIKKFKK